jgi:hypothetical protein
MEGGFGFGRSLRMATSSGSKSGSDSDPSSGPSSGPSVEEEFEENKENFIKWFKEKKNAEGVNNFVKKFNACLQQCKNLKPPLFDNGEKIKKKANYCSKWKDLTLDGFDDVKYDMLKNELDNYDILQYKDEYRTRKETTLNLIYSIEYISKIEEKNETKLRNIQGLYSLLKYLYSNISPIEEIKRFFNEPYVVTSSNNKESYTSGGKRRTKRRTRRRNKKTTKRKANKKTKMKKRKTHKRKTNKRRRR